MPRWCHDPTIRRRQINFELAKGVEQFNRLLAKSVHNLSCCAFRVHFEIINKL